MKNTTTLLSAALLASTASLASAETLRWARAGDSLTMDPHAQNEGPTSALAHQIMEPLVMRDMTGAIVPAPTRLRLKPTAPTRSCRTTSPTCS